MFAMRPFVRHSLPSGIVAVELFVLPVAGEVVVVVQRHRDVVLLVIWVSVEYFVEQAEVVF